MRLFGLDGNIFNKDRRALERQTSESPKRGPDQSDVDWFRTIKMLTTEHKPAKDIVEFLVHNAASKQPNPVHYANRTVERAVQYLTNKGWDFSRVPEKESRSR
jgi:hypothetical protein